MGISLVLILPSSMFVTFHATCPDRLGQSHGRIECRTWKNSWRSRRRRVDCQVVDGTEALCGGLKRKRISSPFGFGGKTAPNGEDVEGETRILREWSDEGT